MQERVELHILVVERLVHRLGRQHRRQRQVAAGQSLGQAHEVRTDARLLAGEQRTGAPEAHRDLVRDQVHLVAVAGRAQQRQVHRVVHAHAGRALHQRLDDHRAALVRVRGERGLHVGEAPPRILLAALARGPLVAVRRGYGDDVHEQRAVDLLVELDVAHGERAERLAVIAVGERDEAALGAAAAVAPVVEAHLQRDFDRGGAVVGIEAAREPRGGERGEGLGERDHRLVREAGEDHLLEPLELRGDRGVDARVGVAEQVHPPGADRIQVTLAVVVLEPSAAGSPYGDHGQLLVILHLRARMPHVGEVACDVSGVGGSCGVHGGIVAWQRNDTQAPAFYAARRADTPMTMLVGIVILVILLSGLRIAQEYQRGVVFRLGRYLALRGPGLYWIMPLGIERTVTIDIRTRTVSAERQETITRDSVTVKVNAVLWYRITDAARSVIAVTDAPAAVYQLALTSLRNIIGQHDLDEVLQERDKINGLLRESTAAATVPWGIEMERFEMKDVELPEAMQQVMAMQAEAIREKRARIIKAEAELEASRKLGDAAEQMANNPVAVELRRMQMVTEVGAENNSTTVLMIPSDFVTLAKSLSEYLREHALRNRDAAR